MDNPEKPVTQDTVRRKKTQHRRPIRLATRTPARPEGQTMRPRKRKTVPAYHKTPTMSLI
jgi:hypothetical protein